MSERVSESMSLRRGDALTGRGGGSAMSKRSVLVLGSTGSIGTQALDVVAAHPDRFVVAGLAAGGGDLDLLARQARDHDVRRVAVARADAAVALRELLPDVEVLAGPDAATE